ncbi:MAG: hypothetical protein M1365_12575 [Actinobacteria bacterium]|nr:hypothetical protein [Actinomycetota bacterium]
MTSKKSGLFTYTTQIDPLKTVNEIQYELLSHGANSILMDYEDGKLSSLSFKIITANGLSIAIELPCNYEAVYKTLQDQYKNKKISAMYATREQAYRVAWRVILYWVKAQMAILETEMVTIDEIFLSYIIVDKGKTLYQKMLDTRFQLTEGKNGSSG